VKGRDSASVFCAEDFLVGSPISSAAKGVLAHPQLSGQNFVCDHPKISISLGVFMARKRITIRLVGSEKDDGAIRLPDFINQLEAFLKALKETERSLSGQDVLFVNYKVVDLSHASPFTVVIEGNSTRESPVRPEKVFSTFVTGVRNIRKKKAPVSANLATLEAYRELPPVHRKIERVEIVEARNKIIPIDRYFTEKVDQVIGPDSFAFGSISGRLEKVNLHNTHRFEIFPTVGPKRVVCLFKDPLLPKVKLALDSYVTVSGRLRYKTWDKFPHAIDAKDVDPHEANHALPTFDELRGIAPKSTVEMSAEDFVRSIRDANW
jgi:hypothetical protein